MFPLASETTWLWAGLAGYAGSAAAAWHGVWSRRSHEPYVLHLLGAGVVFFALAIAQRWLQVGYGPFLTLYEVLLSNLFSLGLIYWFAYWRWPIGRSSALAALPILVVLGLWSLSVPSAPSRLPATYDNHWLWVHVGMGKLFLGTCLVSVGIAGVLLAGKAGVAGGRLVRQPKTDMLDTLAWRFMTLAFVFHSLMLIAGAVWAQDAWGRYWDWDPLETSAFVTWLALGASLHARTTFELPAWSGWLMIVGVFVLAFLTFLGVPFVSLAPHKGML